MGEHKTPQGQGRKLGSSLPDQPRSLMCTVGNLGWSPATTEGVSATDVIRNITAPSQTGALANLLRSSSQTNF